LQALDKVAGRNKIGQNLDPPWHAEDFKEEARKDEGRQKSCNEGNLVGQGLASTKRGDHKPEAESAEQKGACHKGEHQKRSVERQSENKDSNRYANRHREQTEQKVRDDFACYYFPDSYRRRDKGLHRTSLPFSGDNEGRKECAD